MSNNKKDTVSSFYEDVILEDLHDVTREIFLKRSETRLGNSDKDSIKLMYDDGYDGVFISNFLKINQQLVTDWMLTEEFMDYEVLSSDSIMKSLRKKDIEYSILEDLTLKTVLGDMILQYNDSNFTSKRLRDHSALLKTINDRKTQLLQQSLKRDEIEIKKQELDFAGKGQEIIIVADNSLIRSDNFEDV
jgi:hypothetical protein